MQTEEKVEVFCPPELEVLWGLNGDSIFVDVEVWTRLEALPCSTDGEVVFCASPVCDELCYHLWQRRHPAVLSEHGPRSDTSEEDVAGTRIGTAKQSSARRLAKYGEVLRHCMRLVCADSVFQVVLRDLNGALHRATRMRLADLMKVLIDSSADVNSCMDCRPVTRPVESHDPSRTTNLVVTGRVGRREDCMGRVEAHDGSFFGSSAKMPLLWTAVAVGGPDDSPFDILLENGAALNQMCDFVLNVDGRLRGTAVFAAVFWERMSLLQKLIHAGANLERRGSFRRSTKSFHPFTGSPLLLATVRGCAEGVQLLLEGGASAACSPDTYIDDGTQNSLLGSPLAIASYQLETDIVRALLEAKADPNTDARVYDEELGTHHPPGASEGGLVHEGVLYAGTALFLVSLYKENPRAQVVRQLLTDAGARESGVDVTAL